MNKTLLFSFLFFPVITLSQELLTPEEAVRQALEKNFSVRVARNEVRIAENNNSLGNAGFLPEVSSEASFIRSEVSARQEFLDGRIIDRESAGSENLNASVNLNWVIFDGLQMFASLERYKQLQYTSQIELKNEIETSISDIYTAYYNIVREQRLLKLIEYNISLSEERLRIEREKKEIGSGSGFDQRTAEVDLNEDKASFLNEEIRLVQYKLLLKTLTGAEADLDFIVTDSIPLNESFDLEELLQLAEQNNSSLRIAELRRTVSDLEINLARSGFFPQLSVVAGYNFLKSESEVGQLQSNETNGYSYGLRASWNLFNGLNTRRNVENARIASESNQIAYEQARNLILSDIRNYYKVFENSIQRINLEMQNLKSAEENVDIALERLKLGNISPLEFREAQTDLLNTQNRLVSAQVDAKLAETDLLRLSGLLVK
jgi:outer membrane protein